MAHRAQDYRSTRRTPRGRMARWVRAARRTSSTVTSSTPMTRTSAGSPRSSRMDGRSTCVSCSVRNGRPLSTSRRAPPAASDPPRSRSRVRRGWRGNDSLIRFQGARLCRFSTKKAAYFCLRPVVSTRSSRITSTAKPFAVGHSRVTYPPNEVRWLLEGKPLPQWKGDRP